jgi:hypothetical protein
VFESALITRAGVDREVDIGLVAETLFFYRSVHLLLNSSSIVGLATKIPPGDLTALFDRTGVKLTYIRPAFGVVSAGAPRVHQFVAFTFSGTQQKKVRNHREEISTSLERALGTSADTRRLRLRLPIE